MTLVFLVVLPFLIAAWLLTQHVFRPERFCDLPLVFLTIAFGLCYGLNTAVCFVSGYISVPLIIGIGFFLLFTSLIFFFKEKTPAFSYRQLYQNILEFTKLEKLSWFFVLGLLVILFIIGSLLPYRSYDGPGYHAYNAITWMYTNEFKMDTFADKDDDGYRLVGETYSNLKSMLTYVILDVRGEETGTGVTQWPFLVLLCGSLISILRRNNISRWMCPIACLFSIIIPEALIQSSEIYSDIAIYGSLFCLIACLQKLWLDGANWKNILLCVIGFVLVSGVKPVGLPISVGLGTVFLIFVAMKTEGKWSRKFAVMSIGFLSVIVTCSLTTGAWAFHAWGKFGNPIYPIELSVGEFVIFEGPADSTIASNWTKKYTGRTGISAWWWIVSEQYRESSLSSWHNGTGAAFFILGLPAIVFFILFGIILNKSRNELLPITILFAVAWLFTPTLVVPRMILFQVGISAVCLSWMMTHQKKILNSILLGMMLICFLYNFARYIPAVLYRAKPADVIAYGLVSGHTDWMKWNNFPSSYNAGDFWRDTAEAGDKLGVVKGNYTLFLPENKEAEVMHLSYQDIRDADDLGLMDWLTEIRATQVTHLYADSSTVVYQFILDHPEIFDVVVRRRDSLREDSRGFDIPPESILAKINWENVE